MKLTKAIANVLAIRSAILLVFADTRNYAFALRQYVRRDPGLGAQLEIALQEDTHEFEKRFSPGFDLGAYRDFLARSYSGSTPEPLQVGQGSAYMGFRPPRSLPVALQSSQRVSDAMI